MTTRTAKFTTCPAWCASRHDRSGEQDLHVGGALLVQRAVLRLCTSIDPDTGTQDGPFVLVGDAEYTLHEAEALATALTQLVDQGRVPPLVQRPEGVAAAGVP